MPEQPKDGIDSVWTIGDRIIVKYTLLGEARHVELGLYDVEFVRQQQEKLKG